MTVLMRDAFIDTVIEAARADRDVVFISSDFGAKALDAFRLDLPEQFVSAGISEQNMVDVGAGLALAGRKVFLYAMAPFLTARCYEQTKAVLSSMGLPVTLVAVGVGLGYDHATLTHFTPEDLACMRALQGIEIWSPADAGAAAAIAREAVTRPAFRYVRLERNPMPDLYGERFEQSRSRGFCEVRSGADVAIVACGYLVHKALTAAELLRERGLDATVIDLFRIKPLPRAALLESLARHRALVSVEEQGLDGGMGSALCELLCDAGLQRPLRRLGLADRFEIRNGERDELHARYGLDAEHIAEAALKLAAPDVV